MKALTLNQTHAQVQVNSFIRNVYNWMAVGLGLTGFVAYSVSHNAGLVQIIFGNPMVLFGLMLAQLALVFSIGANRWVLKPVLSEKAPF